MQQMSSSTVSTAESSSSNISENERNKKLEHTEKLRLKRKKIQDERRAKLKEFREKNGSIPKPPDASNPEDAENLRAKKAERSAKLRSMKPDHSSLKIMTREDVERVAAFNRELGWGGNSVQTNAYDISNYMMDPGGEYDEWQQAYRTLGAFVDCDHDWGGSHSGDNNGGDRGCNRWMMWAAYIDPNYQGGGYDEYHQDVDDAYYQQDEEGNKYGSLDCHLSSTEWMLLGVYRQEFYQYLEQISKHLWAGDEWEYIVALSALEYIGDDECEAVGYDNNASPLYAAVQPLSMGYFQMGLYSDENCLYPMDLDELGYTYDDFYNGGDRKLANDDGAYQGDDDYYWWNHAQEYTLADANEVYDTFKYCTLCIDYPTYQDGEINGDSGYDDDDLINQCWKFYSHDSFTCGAECIRSGHAQGGITNLKFGENYFGTPFTDETYSDSDSSSSSSSSARSSSQESDGNFLFSREKLDRLKANVFVTFAGILFIATFLAFSVARSSSELPQSALSPKRRRRKSKSGKTTELLPDEEGTSRDERRRRRRRSKHRRRKSSSQHESSSQYEPPASGESSSRRSQMDPDMSSPVSSPTSDGGEQVPTWENNTSPREYYREDDF